MNSLDLILIGTAIVFLVLWIRARRRARLAETRLARCQARADVLLIAAEELRGQLHDPAPAIATARTEARRRHLVGVS
ncbi:MAG: hypothetical protein GC157_18480 [Frankiales bacterium]|nr:hypothetical protein [Frankiales bacterium]